MTPRRIQRRRTRGWRMPESAVYVGRPTRWGSPYPLALYEADYADEYGYNDAERRRMAVSDFRGLVEGRWDRFEDRPDYPDTATIRAHLAGRDLACWCPLDQPCHADVLLEIANAREPS